MGRFVLLKGVAFLGLFSGISGNAGIIGISGKSPIIPSVPIVPFINLRSLRITLLRQNFVMPRLCYGSAEQVNLLCSRLNRKVHFSVCFGTVSAQWWGMKRIIIIVVIVMTAISCNAQSSINRTTVASLDVERYMGSWYEIARFDHSFERDMEYCKAQYSLMPDGKILVENSGVDSRSGKFRVVEGKAKLGSHPGQLRVSFFLFFYSDYNILALDKNYEWALIGSKSPKYLWVLARTPKLPEVVLNEILTEASDRGYDVSKLIMVKQ